MRVQARRCCAGVAVSLAALVVPCATASALSPGELFAVSGVPGANAFLPGLANESSLDEAGGTTTFFESDNTRKLSDDGRYLVFASRADGLSSADNDAYVNIFVQDRVTGAVTLVNVPAPGGSTEGDSTEPVISGDGKEVAFTSTARLSPQDTDAQPDIYLRNLETNTTKLISVRSDGAQGSGSNTEPDLSRDGSTVAFTSTVMNTFSSADTDPDGDIYTANVASGELTLISRASGASGADAAGEASNAAISGNGSVVVFETLANNIDEPTNPDTDTESDVYMRSGTTTTLVSRASGKEGVKGDQKSSDPAITSDGRLVAFTSIATNLVKTKPPFPQEVYMRDTAEGVDETVAVSVQSTSEGGAFANEASVDPTISSASGGTQVAFISTAGNLAAGLTSERARAYVRSIAAGTTTLVSRANGPAGAPAQTTGAASIASVSTEASPPVAFTSVEQTLSSEIDPDFTNVYVREGTTTSWRSRPPPGSPWQAGAGFSGLGGGTGRMISRDGRYVVFMSTANAYRPPGTPARSGALVLVRDLQTGTITIASRADGPAGTAVIASEPSISGDGTKVAFASTEALVSGVPAGTTQVYVRDLATGSTQLASELEGVAGNAESDRPAISGDGQRVAFESTATNLGGPAGQIYEHDLASGGTVLVSRASGAAGAPANQSTFAPSIDADGTHVTFATAATNFDPADKDAFSSIYERDLTSSTTTLISSAPGGAPNNFEAYGSVVSGNGSRVAFITNATNLDPTDTSTSADVYVRDLAAATTTRATQPSSPTFPVETFDFSEDGNTVVWTTREPLLAEDTDQAADLYARDLATATTTLIGRDGTGSPLEAGVDRASVDAEAGCVAMELGGTGEYGYGPVLSPKLPGSTPSPDFNTVILRALTAACLPAPPAAGGSSPPVASVDRTPPVLSHVSLTNKRFRRSRKPTAVVAKSAPRRAKVGTTIRFTLSETATVTATFERPSSGRRVGRFCRPPSARLRRHKRCTRYLPAGRLTRRSLRAGAHGIPFSGRIGSKALALGSYRLTLVASDPAGNRSDPQRLTLTIVAR